MLKDPSLRDLGLSVDLARRTPGLYVDLARRTPYPTRQPCKGPGLWATAPCERVQVGGVGEELDLICLSSALLPSGYVPQSSLMR
jgi:hypothetical protein